MLERPEQSDGRARLSPASEERDESDEDELRSSETVLVRVPSILCVARLQISPSYAAAATQRRHPCSCPPPTATPAPGRGGGKRARRGRFADSQRLSGSGFFVDGAWGYFGVKFLELQAACFSMIERSLVTVHVNSHPIFIPWIGATKLKPKKRRSVPVSDALLPPNVVLLSAAPRKCGPHRSQGPPLSADAR